MKWLILFFLSVLAAVILAAPLFYQTKLNHKISKDIALNIKGGEGFFKILRQIKAEDSEVSLPIAKLYLKLNKLENQLKYGDYHFPKGKRLRAILQDLSEGKVILYKVTIPEGYNIYEIADLLARTELKMDKKEFLTLVQNPKFIEEQIGVRAKSLEGYLYPSTYEFSKNTKPYTLVRHLIKTFFEHQKPLLKKYPLPLDLNSHEVVTLASVVEKETGAPQERKIIASVFLNRLKKGMRLQSDPTTIYGEWTESGERLFNIQKKHLLRTTPYNTYKVSRLPAGPISNPGGESLEAVLAPESTDYLYFVSQNDGTHYFSKTYREHINAVRRFQMSRKAREGKSWRNLKKD